MPDYTHRTTNDGRDAEPFSFKFERITDPRERLLARLNLALRAGGVDADDVLAYDAIKAGVQLVDFERQVVAQHLLSSLEHEVGRPCEEWFHDG